MSNYSSMLRDPRWQRKRLEIMKRDNFTCVACYRTHSTLHVHHIEYVTKPWISKDKDMQTLCEKCHEALGIHPNGGIGWQIEGGTFIGFFWRYCPMCGSKNLIDRQSYDQCGNCSHEIRPIGWPVEITETPQKILHGILMANELVPQKQSLANKKFIAEYEKEYKKTCVLQSSFSGRAS